MEIIKTKEGSKMTIALEGRLDTTTAPSLDAVVGSELGDVTELVYDFNKLEYVSSAGLRVLLLSQKTMNAKGGTMVIRNVNSDIMEVFEMTGFSSVLTIEEKEE
ncbi:MAG: STAS domain-containing protein [Eubacteriales bacterium]|nr:STAS domain-containing protein [Lachnospiraceae bacterium]MDO4808957.1 STAS domain-containing protein [Eubacteriales bacterium]